MRIAQHNIAEHAAQWGSYMTGGDPGACMYGFDDSGRVQSESHRAECIAWIDGPCRKAATANIAAGDPSARQDHETLDALRAAILAATVDPDAWNPDSPNAWLVKNQDQGVRA